MTLRSIKDRDPDAKLKRIQRRFDAIYRRRDRQAKMRRLMRRFLFFAFHPVTYIALIIVIVLVILLSSPWPIGITIKHYMTAPNCDAARAMGLAPALRGKPGYWSKHDRDKDGIACEPYSGQ